MVKCLTCGRPTGSSDKMFCYKHRGHGQEIRSVKPVNFVHLFFVFAFFVVLGVSIWWFFLGGQDIVFPQVVQPVDSVANQSDTSYAFSFISGSIPILMGISLVAIVLNLFRAVLE